MKKTLFFAVLTLMWACTAVGQVAPTDSTSRSEKALGDTPRSRRGGERNVLGAPVYYDTLGNVLGSSTPADSIYHRPPHHFRNRLEDEFCSTFLEFTGLFAHNDFAVGARLSYVPERWGLYGSGSVGFRHTYFSAGPVLRVSDCGDMLDLQVYGGLTLSRWLGSEAGVRLALPYEDKFCWTSMVMGLGYVNRHTYFTIGFSLSLQPGFFFLW